MKSDRRQFLRKISTLGIGTFLAAIFEQNVGEASTTTESDRRIQKNRTARLEIHLVDQDDKPIVNQTIKIKHLRHLFHFGAAYHDDLILRQQESDIDRLHREYFLQLFNAATVTFYWRYYEPQENEYADKALLQKITWLKQHHFYLRGHPLFWNHNPACLPTWLENREIASSEVKFQMDKVLTHMSEVIFPHLDEVDVFNELVNWDNYDHPFTDLFKEQGKLAIVKQYLTKFKQLNPQVKAVINDFVANSTYAELLRELQNSQVPFDVIGQQAHMFRENWSMERLTAIADRLSIMGKTIVFTEVSSLSGAIKKNLDFSRNYTDWKSDRYHEQKQADYLESFYRFAFSHPQISGIYLWSYSDRGAWLGAPTGILHQDGKPKPAFTRLDRLINHAWRTNVELQTDSSGYAIVANAFEGEYEITAGDRLFTGQHSPNQPLQILIRR